MASHCPSNVHFKSRIFHSHVMYGYVMSCRVSSGLCMHVTATVSKIHLTGEAGLCNTFTSHHLVHVPTTGIPELLSGDLKASVLAFTHRLRQATTTRLFLLRKGLSELLFPNNQA